MSTWVIGDLQGCFDELQVLLRQIEYTTDRDRLWFAGDLVSRGPKSLECLRFVRGLGPGTVTVLGNHDLHLLAMSQQASPARKSEPSLQAVLAAPDAPELLGWLRQQSLLHHDPASGYTLVHAGLAPEWTLAQAQSLAREIEAELRGPAHAELLRHMYGDQPVQWSSALADIERWRFGINCFTRLRYVTRAGALALKAKGPPGSQNAGEIPWYAHPERRTRGEKIVFGHWSALGRFVSAEHSVWGLDSGCVWGGALTALRLDDGALVSTPCPAYQAISD